MEGLSDGRDRQKVMTLATGEFIRRFLIHVLPHGFHRIRHYGLFASGTRAGNIARARELLTAAKPEGQPTLAAVDPGKPTCPCCGGRLVIIEVFARGATPRPTRCRHLSGTVETARYCAGTHDRSGRPKGGTRGRRRSHPRCLAEAAVAPRSAT